MKIRLLFFFYFIQLIPDSTFAQSNKNRDSRKFFVETMVKIANPVLRSLSVNELKKNMPVVVSSKQVVDRTQFTYLEAFGRTVSGISPWLELGPEATNEGKLREEYIRLTLKYKKC